MTPARRKRRTTVWRRLASAAFVLALAPAGLVSASTTIVDSNGFELPDYFPGDLTGQSGWLHAGSDGSSASVQSSVVKTGGQAVQVDRRPNVDGRWAVPVRGFPADRYVIIRWDMNVAQTWGVPFGPFFGVEAYDDNGGFGLLGALGVDASTADILYQHEDDGFLVETGTLVDFDRWNAFAIRLDYVRHEYSVFCNGEWLATTGFVDRAVGLDDFTDADISTLGAAADAASQAATGTAYFDNFSVIEAPRLAFGDLDLDGVVADGDLNLLLSSFAQAGEDLAADLDFDALVGRTDLEMLLASFGRSPPAVPLSVAPVPEPSGLVLAALAFGGLFFCAGTTRLKKRAIHSCPYSRVPGISGKYRPEGLFLGSR